MKKRILIISIIFFTLLIVLFLLYSFLNSGFIINRKSFNYEYAEKIDYKDVKICYKFGFFCFESKNKFKSSVDSLHLGTYKVSSNSSFLFFKKKLSFNINIVDTTKPSINLNQDKYLICPNGKLLNYNVSATDNVDGDISSLIKYEYVDNILTFIVIDSNGNESRVNANSEVFDNSKPVITLNKGDITLKNGTKYIEYGYSATDDCDGDITSLVDSSNNIDINKNGTYYVNYSVKDSMGNEGVAKRKVVVYSVNYSNVSIKNDNVSGSSKVIYLTFDDGPSAYTSKVLDILNKYNVKATFFVTGNGQGYKNNITRAYNEGHVIGLHTYTHNYNIYSNSDTYFNDLYGVQDYVYNLIGSKSYIMRFPGGSSNTVSKNYNQGIMSFLANEVQNKGFKYFDWNVTTGDGGNVTTNQAINNFKNGIANKSVSLVLMHDTKSATVNGLEEMIVYALSNGYRFDVLNMSSTGMHHGINN